MRNLCGLLLLFVGLAGPALAQTAVVGQWKRISHTVEHQGRPIDSHAALLQQRPCTANIVYEFKANGELRLDASQSGCEDKYRRMQERLYSETRWKVQGDRITTFTATPEAGQTYVLRVSGDRMTWTGTAGQGVIVYQRQ